MKYIFTEQNVKWDSAYANAMYFLNDTTRDEFVNNKLMNGKDYKIELDKAAETYGNILSPTGGTIEIQNPFNNVEELFEKNTIILNESKVNANPKFYFIDDVQQLDNNNMFELTLSVNLFLTYTHILRDNNQMDLIEGHVNDASILDMVLDGGYKTPYNIKPLERDFDFEGTYPGKDVGMLNNKWVYVFIEQSNSPTGDKPLFKINGQVKNYRVLMAPWEPIIVQDNSELKTVISYVNERWDSVNYFHNEKINVDDGDIRGDQEQLERERINDVINIPEQDKGDIKISFNYNKTDMKSVNKVVSIPFDKLELYKDNWFPIHIGDNELEYNIANRDIWNTTDKTKPGNTPSIAAYNIIAFEMKYDTFNNKFITRALKRGRTSSDTLYALNRRQHAAWFRQWLVFVPTKWVKSFSYGTSNQPGEPTDSVITPASKDDIKWPYMCNETGAFTTVVFETDDWNRPMNWNFTIKEVYQGQDTEIVNKVWNASSLLNYVNSKSIPEDGNTEIVVAAYNSSFNAIELDANGFPTNLKIKDTLIPVTPDTWDNTEIYELIEQNTDYNKLLNKYDLTKYTDKSWLKGLENYSIVIENNKEFDIKPEFIYSIGEFTHDVILTPNEWTERIKFEGGLHNEGLEFSNTKEMLFATNIFNEYQVNNPGALKNQAFNNNLRSLEAIAELGIGVGSGGIGAIAGVKSIGNNVVDRINYKQNITMMKNQPINTTGSGSAYSDLYLNNNAFGLTLVEWQYTTPQALSVVNNVIRNGLSQSRTIVVNFNAIKRPEFNYIKVTNGMEMLSSVELGQHILTQFADVFEKGVRLWYNPDNYLNYDVNNNSLFSKDMINCIDWNDKTKKE